MDPNGRRRPPRLHPSLHLHRRRVGTLALAVTAAIALLAVGCGRSRTAGEPTVAATPSTTSAPEATTSAAAAATPANPANPACRQAGEVARDVRYRDVPAGADPALVTLDRYGLGDGCTGAPIWIWVHGGGWQRGSKAHRIADKVALARAQGWVLVSVDYRLSPGTPEAPVRWPDHDDDVAAAVAWVRDHALELGGDPDRLLLSGHSAGGGIAAAVAGDPRYLAAVGLDPTAIRCAAIFDTEGYDVAVGAASPVTGDLYRQAFGDDPDGWDEASPIQHLAPGGTVADQLVVTRGLPDRRQGAAAYVAAVEATGSEADLLDAGGLSHAEVNAAIGRADDEVVTPAFTAWAEACLAP